MKKRDKLEIMKDILQIIFDRGDRLKPTHIMYKANLSHQMLVEYTTELVEKELIEIVDEGRKIHRITNKGRDFLRDYKMMRGFMDSYGLE
jgi:predicted transcriptional regulator